MKYGQTLLQFGDWSDLVLFVLQLRAAACQTDRCDLIFYRCGSVIMYFDRVVNCHVRVVIFAVLGGVYCRHLQTSDCPAGYRQEASRRCSDRFQNSVEELKFTGRQMTLDQRYNRTCLSVYYSNHSDP